jgi:hypothetical protein
MCQNGLVTDSVALMNKIVAKSFVPGVKVWETLLLNLGSTVTYTETTFVELLGPK